MRLRPRQSDLERTLQQWLAEYSNPGTQRRYRISVSLVAAHTGANSPTDLTPARVATWAQSHAKGKANNTMRMHLQGVRLYLRWCHETGHLPEHRDGPFRRIVTSYPPTYGKVQGAKPANRLAQDDYRRLLAACQDGTDAGLRDELFVRLGVGGGMRVAELLHLTVGTVRRAPQLDWIGKANKPRTAVAGPELVAAITAYLGRYASALGHPPLDTDPLFCPVRGSGDSRQRLRWGVGITQASTMRKMLVRRAGVAQLGWLAPHDLKRSAARMMHEARGTDGGHLFDLLDIADVLDHSNPKVTKDCYIGPLDTANKERAAVLFG